MGADNLCHLAGCSADPWLLGSALPARAWDDLRLVGLRLIFLIVTRSGYVFTGLNGDPMAPDRLGLQSRHRPFGDKTSIIPNEGAVSPARDGCSSQMRRPARHHRPRLVFWDCHRPVAESSRPDARHLATPLAVTARDTAR